MLTGLSLIDPIKFSTSLTTSPTLLLTEAYHCKWQNEEERGRGDKSNRERRAKLNKQIEQYNMCVVVQQLVWISDYRSWSTYSLSLAHSPGTMNASKVTAGTRLRTTMTLPCLANTIFMWCPITFSFTFITQQPGSKSKLQSWCVLYYYDYCYYCCFHQFYIHNQEQWILQRCECCCSF